MHNLILELYDSKMRLNIDLCIKSKLYFNMCNNKINNTFNISTHKELNNSMQSMENTLKSNESITNNNLKKKINGNYIIKKIVQNIMKKGNKDRSFKLILNSLKFINSFFNIHTTVILSKILYRFQPLFAIQKVMVRRREIIYPRFITNDSKIRTSIRVITNGYEKNKNNEYDLYIILSNNIIENIFFNKNDSTEYISFDKLASTNIKNLRRTKDKIMLRAVSFQSKKAYFKVIKKINKQNNKYVKHR